MDNTYKEVYFDQYCKKCVNKHTDESDDPCYDCLETPARENSHTPINFKENEEKIDDFGMPVLRQKISDYLYLFKYTELDDRYADEYYDKNTPIVPMACSSVRNGKYYGRNLDWLYDNSAEFVVIKPRIRNKYATIGVAGGLTKLTDDYVSTHFEDPLYKIVPFQLYDGMNEKGLVANINVVPTDYGKNVSIPKKRTYAVVSALQVIRYILDRFATAEGAVRFIRDHMEIHFPQKLHQMHYELHYMIADENKTYCVEFSDNEAKIIDITDKPYMTNFHLQGVRFNQDGTVYTPETQDDFHNANITNLITDYGGGLERYNLIVNNYTKASTLLGMKRMMESLRYSRAYPSSENPANWYTEFVGVRDLTVASPVSDYEPVMDIVSEYYEKRTRTDGKTWHTVHSSVYDIYHLELHVQSQEKSLAYVFKL